MSQDALDGGVALPLVALHADEVGDEVGADRLDERGVGDEVVERCGEVRRRRDGRC